jgi:hypothetical protein
MARSNLSDFFVWGDGGAALTPEEIAQRRKVEAALIGRGVDTSPVGHWTQGAARVADAIAGAFRRGQLDDAEKELNTYNQGLASPLIDALSGGSSPTASAATSGVAQEMAATSPSIDPSTIAPEIRAGIVETANALGIDPVDLGTAISYETAGTFDPTKAGPTTQWGQHKGLIQFGEPQAKQYGVDWNNPVGSQLGANGAVANYLRSTGVKPGMGMMDIYSAINAGGVGRYGASDANNGGAPGTVADKVNQQMGGHRANALALLGATPSAGAAAIEQAAPASGYVDPMVSAPNALPSQASSFEAAPPLPAATNIAPAPAVATAPQQPMQVAQNSVPPAALAQALRVMADPRANPATKQVAEVLIRRQQAQEQAAQEQAIWVQRQNYERQQQAGDPYRQLQIQKLQQDVSGGSRQSLVNAGDGRLYDPNTQSWITAPDAASKNFRQATPEEVKAFGTNGQVGPDGKFYPITPPQGTALSVDPNTGAVTFNQGAGVKPLTEGQSKDAFFTTRMTANVPTIDKFEQNLTAPDQVAADYLPGGRYYQSEEYQLARDAGDDFVAAYLRKDSGAALTKEERTEYGRMLLPQPGDKPAAIAAKRQRRQIAIKALESGMPPQAIDNVIKAIGSVDGADQPAMTTEERKKSNRTSSGVEWSLD